MLLYNRLQRRNIWWFRQNVLKSKSLNIKPPLLLPKPQVSSLRQDEFAFLQDHDSMEVMKYIDKEQEYVQAISTSYATLTKTICRELEEWNQVDVVKPLGEVSNGHAYYFNDGVYYKQKEGEEFNVENSQVLLDTNAFDSGTSVTSFALSNCEKFIAYVEKTVGEEDGILRFKNISNDENLNWINEEEVGDVVNFVWVDGGVLYTKMNIQLRPYKVKLHLFRQGLQEDKVIYKENDDRFFLDVGKTKDKKYITINSHSRTSSEVHVVDISDLCKIKMIAKKKRNVEYFVDHHQDKFFIVSNGLNKNGDFELLYSPSNEPEKWKHVLNIDEKFKLEDVDIFENHMVLYVKENGYSNVMIFDIPKNELTRLDLPEKISSIQPGINRDFFAKKIRFIYQAAGYREIVYEYDFVSKALDPIRTVPIPNFSRNDYIVRRIEIPLKLKNPEDGLPNILPVTLIHSKNVGCLNNLTTQFSTGPIDLSSNTSPVLIHSYNAYGIETALPFEPHFLPFLKRNWVIALCHGSGGSEFGKRWYRRGMGPYGKRRAVDELEYFLQLLKAQGHETAALGISAGGCIIGSLLSRSLLRLEKGKSLLDAAVMHVPFLDPVTAMLDPLAALTSTEREEWGDVENLDLLRSYAPYDTIPSYTTLNENMAPSLYLTAGWKDLRVPYWHPLKYTAKLRSNLPQYYGQESLKLQESQRPKLLMNTRKSSGHFGDTSEATAEDTAAWISFLIHEIEKRQKSKK